MWPAGGGVQQYVDWTGGTKAEYFFTQPQPRELYKHYLRAVGGL